MAKSCVMLFSGGADSTTLLYKLISDGWDVNVLSIDYGQRHSRELECSKKICSDIELPRKVVSFKLDQFGDSPLTNKDIRVPDQTQEKQRKTVVGFRNTMFCTLAGMYAQTLGVQNIFIAPCKEDFAVYRDCRRDFFDVLEEALSLGGTQEDSHIEIHTPFIDMWKKDIVKLGVELDVPYQDTHTCYLGREKACGKCDACVERIQSFKDNKTVDPIDYEISVEFTQSAV